jgi:hypothetical protein
MKKAEVVELINRKFQNRWHPKYVEFYISRVLNELLFQSFSVTNYTFYDQFTKVYYDVDVSYDEIHKEYYITLPEEIIQVPGISSGVRSIEPNSGEIDIMFAPVTINQAKVYKGLEAGQQNETLLYTVQNKKIEFIWDMRLANIKKLKLRLCIPFDKYGDDENVNIPLGLEQTLVDKTYASMQNKPVDDTVNDGNEKTK